MARLKFHQDIGLATALTHILKASPAVAPVLKTADWLVPLPLAPQRLAERGYNPAQLLAMQLDSTRCRNDLLVRVRHTRPQRGLTRAARLKNVRGVYAATERAMSDLPRRHVVLIDDVMTTGASLRSAALALRRAGASRISAICFARADTPR